MKNDFSFTILISNILLFLGFTAFTLSLFMISFYTNTDDIAGYWVLVTGWMGLVFIQFAWYANPIHLIALLLMNKNPLQSLLLSILALALATTAFQLTIIPTGIHHDDKVYIQEYGIGVFLWYISHCCCLLSILFRSFLPKNIEV